MGSIVPNGCSGGNFGIRRVFLQAEIGQVRTPRKTKNKNGLKLEFFSEILYATGELLFVLLVNHDILLVSTNWLVILVKHL